MVYRPRSAGQPFQPRREAEPKSRIRKDADGNDTITPNWADWRYFFIPYQARIHHGDLHIPNTPSEKSILKRWRNNFGGSITVLNAPKNQSNPFYLKIYGLPAPDKLNFREKLLQTLNYKEPSSRLVIVDDLSPLLVETIGSAYWMSPEFFLAHLYRSRCNPAFYKQIPPPMWNTSIVPQDYVSVSWYRPVNIYCHLLALYGEDDEVQSAGAKSLLSFNDRDRGPFQLATNIFRNHLQLSTTRAFTSSSNSRQDAQDETQIVQGGWEETVTVYRGRGRHASDLVILLDPLPLIQKFQGARKRFVPVFEQAHARAAFGSSQGLHSVYDGTQWNRHTFTKFTDSVKTTRSTKDDLQDLMDWCTSQQTFSTNRPERAALLSLIWIICLDMKGFLGLVGEFLLLIGRNSLNDSLLQRSLSSWRGILSRLEFELPRLKGSVERFVTFAEEIDPGIQIEYAFIAETISYIDNVMAQHKASYTALRGDIGIVDSKRGIAQTETLGKLTELGFIFIPISCVATIFSMQVNELKDNIPLWYFTLTATLTMVFVYSVRLIIRSEISRGIMHKFGEIIRYRAEIWPGRPIPTHSLLKAVTPSFMRQGISIICVQLPLRGYKTIRENRRVVRLALLAPVWFSDLWWLLTYPIPLSLKRSENGELFIYWKKPRLHIWLDRFRGWLWLICGATDDDDLAARVTRVV